MDSDDSKFSDSGDEKMHSTAKKRKKTGRLKDVMKVLRAESHELGPDCCCKNLRCFEAVPMDQRKRIIRQFNALGDVNKQNSYLGGLISVLPVIRRGKKEDQTRYNTASFAYRVRGLEDGVARDVRVCLKAFMSMHGISEDKVRYIRQSLVATGTSPTDQRGKHSNRPHKLTEETKGKMHTYLKSLKGRKSHYSLKKSEKIYLSEELNVKKLHNMYIDQYPENGVSYESFREYFENEFNFSFGYPRKDTCSTCDSLKSEISMLVMKDPSRTDSQLAVKEREKQLHLKQSERFYELKKMILFLAAALSSASAFGLRLWKPCGEKNCTPYQYCSDLFCQNCDKVCTSSENNFDRATCENECQEYIHDKIRRYLTQDEIKNNTQEIHNYVNDKIKQYMSEADPLKATQDLQDTIEWLRQLVAASLILSLTVVVVVVAVFGFLWLRYRRKKGEMKEMDLDSKIKTVSGMMNNNCKDKLPRLDMSSIGSNTAAPSVITGVTTTTPISTRHPCEDATLEYAYDNQGMTPSPVLQESRNETTF